MCRQRVPGSKQLVEFYVTAVMEQVCGEEACARGRPASAEDLQFGGGHFARGQPRPLRSCCGGGVDEMMRRCGTSRRRSRSTARKHSGTCPIKSVQQGCLARVSSKGVKSLLSRASGKTFKSAKKERQERVSSVSV